MNRAWIMLLLATILFPACRDLPGKKAMMDSEETREMKPDSSGYVPVNGLNMYYEIHGRGTPLVLIHGGGSTIGTTFGRVLPALSRTHMVVALELQAHGHTADISRPLSFKQDADDVAGLLKQLRIAKADIFGFSNGASTTLELAIRHPEKVNKIIVASTMFKKSGAYPAFWDMMERATFDGMPGPLKEAYLRINSDQQALRRMYDRDVARMQSFPDIPETDIKAIRAPALIIAGNADVVSPEHVVEMYRLMPKATLAILPGAHGEYLGEITTPQDPEFIAATVSMIEKFLREPFPERP